MSEPKAFSSARYETYLAFAKKMAAHKSEVGSYDPDLVALPFLRRNRMPALLLETVGDDLLDPDCAIWTFDILDRRWCRAVVPLSSLSSVPASERIVRLLRAHARVS